jgi:molecular chaperone HscB
VSDPFSTLGVEPVFDLDIAALERRHRELSRQLHPDRYVGKPAGERRQALGRAIEMNDAWRVLKDPIRRAEALLALRGTPVGETNEPKPDQELLMEMMEQRESLSEARQSRDAARLEKLAAAMRTRSASVERALGEALADKNADAALRHLGELRYLRRFLDEAAAIEDELF